MNHIFKLVDIGPQESHYYHCVKCKLNPYMSFEQYTGDSKQNKFRFELPKNIESINKDLYYQKDYNTIIYYEGKVYSIKTANRLDRRFTYIVDYEVICSMSDEEYMIKQIIK